LAPLNAKSKSISDTTKYFLGHDFENLIMIYYHFNRVNRHNRPQPQPPQPGSDQDIKLKYHNKCTMEGHFHGLNLLFLNQNEYDKMPGASSVNGRFRSK
jgi:hypothetical protein